MATVRQYDGDNAIERWRHCDDTTAKVRYDYRIVAPYYRPAAIVLSHCRIVVIVLARFRNRTNALPPSYCRTVVI
ncbi:hypothetical protein DPMN_123423, partial [Dreissena polymorpha]